MRLLQLILLGLLVLCASPSGAAPTVLPFSEARQAGNLLFLAGQIGTLPGKSELVAGGIEPEARQTMENIRQVLEKHGLDMGDIVKCTVMLADIGEWASFNRIYVQFFEQPYPARSAFAAAGLALNARVEVECIAQIPGS